METVTVGPSEALQAFRAYTLGLQEAITTAVANEDGQAFEFKEWTRPEGGGGRTAMLRGDVIEKGACHTSHVWGSTNPLTGRPFHAVGLSLILHPWNPHCPTVHLNVRRFEEEGASWWGGGTDLTPLGIRHEEDVQHFHGVLQRSLGTHYGTGKLEADHYFQVPHRGRARGAGGVFYDRLDSGDFTADAALVRSIGDSFLDAWIPILVRRKNEAFTQDDRERQLVERGVYVEFNLLNDRGTRFGFQSGGNIDAILSSLPPTVRWP